MVNLVPVPVAGGVAVGITVELPKTRLVVLAGDRGYLMCGALDVALLDGKLHDRRIVAGRAVGVRTLEDLLAAPLERVTSAAREIGIVEGMTGRDALALLVAPADGGATSAGRGAPAAHAPAPASTAGS